MPKSKHHKEFDGDILKKLQEAEKNKQRIDSIEINGLKICAYDQNKIIDLLTKVNITKITLINLNPNQSSGVFFRDFKALYFGILNSVVKNEALQSLTLGQGFKFTYNQYGCCTTKKKDFLPETLLGKTALKALEFTSKKALPKNTFDSLIRFLMHQDNTIESLTLNHTLSDEEFTSLNFLFAFCPTLKTYHGSHEKELQEILDNKNKQQTQLDNDYATSLRGSG